MMKSYKELALHYSVDRLLPLLCLAVAFQASPLRAHAQANAKSGPLMLVTWFGPGGIALPEGGDWQPEMLTVYDHVQRPVAQFKKSKSGLPVSFILFENHSGNPTAAGCREDAINAIVHSDAKLISRRIDGETRNAAGQTLATTSYLLDLNHGRGPHQHNLFGFAGNAKTCAEIHISGVSEIASEEAAMKSVLAGFQPELTYQPKEIDYFRIASALFKDSPGLAAPYYKSALAALPADPSVLAMRRITTDQLVMSLGMSGDLENSRAVARMAIAADPDYPINYYNLACADAEQGKVADARLHLQQAFDRRANVLAGESMPDPTKDDSLVKLKENKEFWGFVKALPGN